MQRKWMMMGAVLTMLSVAIGAFGAHMLKESIGADAIAVYETGVQYHMIHAIGLLIIGLTAGQLGPSTKLKWAARLLFIGIIVFSGSLYVLSISGIKILGAITPIGGVAFIVGWLLLAMDVWQRGKDRA
ncbi:DUF423 domain-containing protein [Paenibacillus sp. UMB7766-LJ446]|jgi:uncharacterized membrane protein YgdD (TMEM256/DUF423 family)|uniref:DUF423 domain-containing protein n=1 Tax=unclassified Paenibacillus TaxID=185978 RepID=UPI000423C3FD|nr:MULTISPECIES: DUF423 domain-containing protein [unclassified Paenibacillus]OPG98514.1 DUF423 domain-containing protein [Chryseobacterium mucoviscidosis]KGP80796.1 membrane protein [Paenibacillus sp. MAEPY1]KGP84254.1 membrane protein [Paenibacillus sp. MAEPY2]MDK8188857.1 DUF423 domain-containing protein [Paenibacillus sp. UMB7766-LJ446]MDN8590042.1 DUF423 domain-containing protein [Paenibacillus sp. 11B]